MENFKLILVDPKPALCAAYHERFAGLPDVEIVQGRFEQFGGDDGCLTPADLDV